MRWDDVQEQSQDARPCASQTAVNSRVQQSAAQLAADLRDGAALSSARRLWDLVGRQAAGHAVLQKNARVWQPNSHISAAFFCISAFRLSNSC